MNTNKRALWGPLLLISLLSFLGSVSVAAPAGGVPSLAPPALPQTTSTPNIIQNFVFLDLDADGVRDGGEQPLVGVTVNLHSAAGDLLATTTTNAEGQYTFRPADGVELDSDYEVRFNPRTNTSALPGGFFNADLTATNAAAQAGRRDNSGFTIPFDLALRTTVDSSSVNISARTVRFNLTVINQGRTVESFQLIDYLDYGGAGQWANFVPGLNPAGSAGGRSWSWNARNPQRPVVTVNGTLGTGDQVSIPIVLRWNDPLPSGTAALENWAEIVNFDDGDPSTGDAVSGDLTDRDSTPDRQASADAQPSGYGAVTDDEINGRNGDEDDHDVAGFGLFDLALTMQLSDGSNVRSILPGSRADFTITVTNQGLVDATGIVITNYLPTAGLRLNDPAWAVQPDGSARIGLPGRLGPGESTTVDISFVATANASGQINNWAEISGARPVDSGGQTILDNRTNRPITDVDSTFDSIFVNDDRPAGPGDATDDEILGRGGDEDDHDVAGIRMGFFDLALTSTIGGGAKTGVAPIGNAVVFNHRITNQGTVDATDIVVVNYLPESGLTLVDPDWNDNGNGTATLITPVPGPLEPGESIVVPITFMVDASAVGTIYNWAEIAGADTDGDPTTRTPVDVDSRPGNNPRYDSDPTALPAAPAFVPAAAEPATGVEETAESADSAADDQQESDTPEEAAAPAAPTTITSVAGPSEDDHDIAGVSIEPPVFDLALSMVVSDEIDVEGLSIEDDVTFEITVFNQGTVFADNIVIVDFLPAHGLELADSRWVEESGGIASLAITEPIAPDTFEVFEVNFVVGEGALGTIDNTVEIAEAQAVDFLGDPIVDVDNDPLADADSVPYGDLDPTNPGAEDDHSIASVFFPAPPIHNLSLFSDLSDGSNRSVFLPGDTVSYDVTVLNNGELLVADIDLVTQVPEGFSLTGRDWDASGAAATLRIDGPLLPGQSETITIEFKAEAEASGTFDNRVWIARSTPVDEDGEVLTGTNGEVLPDIDSTDDETTLELSVIPTLAFNGVEVDTGLLVGWGLLAMGTFVGLLWVAKQQKEQRGVRVGLVGPAASRWGPVP